MANICAHCGKPAATCGHHGRKREPFDHDVADAFNRRVEARCAVGDRVALSLREAFYQWRDENNDHRISEQP